MADRTSLRSLGEAKFLDPRRVLESAGPLQVQLALSSADVRVKRLRTNPLKQKRETWHGAIFTYAWSELWRKPLRFAARENEDYDILVQAAADRVLVKVQLKELPPKDLNPNLKLEDIVKKCRSRRNYDLRGTTVAIFINNEDGRLTEAQIPEQGDPDIWLFGFAAPDQSRIFIAGHNPGGTGIWTLPHPYFSEPRDA